MATLLQSPPNPISLREVSEISQSLAEDLGRLHWRTEGFTEEDYLSLDGMYFVEYIDGCLQVLPMPDSVHQVLAFLLCTLLKEYAKQDAGARILLAPFKVKLRSGQYREPDVCYMRGINAHRRTRTSWDRADLVVEIISDSNRDHDWVTKRREYALNGIPEYWIVDPDHRRITVLTLNDKTYDTHGELGDGQQATSKLLDGFGVDVKKLFDDAEAAA